MLIVYEGQTYPFDFDDIGVQQAIAIERHTGLSFADWGTSLEKGGNLLSLQAMGWLILTGGDLDAPIGGVNFKMAKLGAAFAAAAQAEADAEAAKAGPPPAAVLPAAPEANGSAAADGPLSQVYSDLTSQ
jgi:hypothetical protein